jgi:DNA-binding NtrC family response regulator
MTFVTACARARPPTLLGIADRLVPVERIARRCEMTRVLVVHHDLDLAGQEADSLRRFGYEVTECSGPTRNHCPILAGRPCDLAEGADVLVYDVWASGDMDGSQTLIENIRDIHPDTPVVLTSPGPQLGWEETAGRHGVTVLEGQPTGVRLHAAIQAALGSAAALPA